MVPGGGGRRRARARGHERAARDPHRPGPDDDSCSPLGTWMHVVCSRSWVFASPKSPASRSGRSTWTWISILFHLPTYLPTLLKKRDCVRPHVLQHCFFRSIGSLL